MLEISDPPDELQEQIKLNLLEETCNSYHKELKEADKIFSDQDFLSELKHTDRFFSKRIETMLKD